MSRFLQVLTAGPVLLMDGAMGTELQRAGLDITCNDADAWNETYPNAVRAVHEAYLAAGATCLVTNTFNTARLHKTRNQHAVYVRGTQLARSASDGSQLVLLSVGPPAANEYGFSGASWSNPAGTWHGNPADYAEPLLAVTAADAILIETQPHLGFPARLVEWLAAAGPSLPLLVSFCYGHVSGKGWQGGADKPERAARWAQANRAHVAALGVNCGLDIGMDQILNTVRRYRRETDLPLFAQPNAGSPTRVGDRWVYPHTPQEMAARLPELLEAGVSMIGGCCGTTPEHIAAFKVVVDAWNLRRSSRF